MSPLWIYLTTLKNAFNKTILPNLDILDCVDSVSNTNIKSSISGPDACEVTPHSKPWIVNFGIFNDRSFCGGTIIGNKFVLTAAHCACSHPASSCNPMEDSHLRIVVVGDHDRKTPDLGEETIDIETIIY